MCVHTHVCARTHTCGEVRGQLEGSFLSFHHVDPGDETQVTRFGDKCLVSHTTGSKSLYLTFIFIFLE